MNPRSLAALLSSLISQLLILLFLLFPLQNPLSGADYPPRDFQELLFPLVHHVLSTSEIAAALSLASLSRKRKRVREMDEDDGGDQGFSGSRHVRVLPDVYRNPESFKQFFKMKTSTFEWLCGLLEPLLECRDPVESPLNLPAETRLGIGLFRLATGADYQDISVHFRVSEADSKFCVKQLCRVLCTNFRFWVRFPSQPELDSVSTQFQTLTGLPNCCGILTCTRFNIESANRSDGIAAQIVVDSSSRILSVIAGFHGDRTDTQILKSSTLFKDIDNGLILSSSSPINVDEVDIPQYFLGDGEYTLLPWLILPFLDPERGSAEENFNKMHVLMRVSSMKAIASLKNWGVLRRPIEMEHKIAVACIGACSILHNMLISREDYSAFCSELDDEDLHSQRKAGLMENLIEEEKAIIIRKALATRAKNRV